MLVLEKKSLHSKAVLVAALPLPQVSSSLLSSLSLSLDLEEPMSVSHSGWPPL